MRPYMLLSQEEFFKKVSAGSIILGDAVGLYREAMVRHIRGATLLDKDAWYPKPHQLVAQALERLKDKKFNNAFDIKPIYLYPKECQIKNSSKFVARSS